MARVLLGSVHQRKSTTMNFTILTRVARIDERFKTVHVSGVGPDAIMREVSLGWFVQFERSQEALFCGAEKPSIEVGDEYEIKLINRSCNALPR